jgi:hypothetical protein
VDGRTYADGNIFQDAEHNTHSQNKQQKRLEIQYADVLVHRKGCKWYKRILYAACRQKTKVIIYDNTVINHDNIKGYWYLAKFNKLYNK